jgi:ribosomal protein L19E
MSMSRAQAQGAAHRAKHQTVGGQQQRKPALKIKMNTVNGKPVIWSWYPRIPCGQMTILGAPGGMCKGLIAASAASAVSTGGVWPTESDRAAQGTILWCETEDPLAEVIRPRLDAAGADCSRIYYVKPDGFALDDVRNMIKREELRLIIMSPMISSAGPARHQFGTLRTRRASGIAGRHRGHGMRCARHRSHQQEGRSARDRACARQRRVHQLRSLRPARLTRPRGAKLVSARAREIQPVHPW